MNRFGFTLTDDEVIALAADPDAVPLLFLRDIRRNQINTEEILMAKIDRLEALIKSEVGEALAAMQQRVDDALAAADASDAQRDAVQSEFDNFQARVDNLSDRVEAEGLFGQDDPEPVEEPVDPEPTEPTEPEAEA